MSDGEQHRQAETLEHVLEKKTTSKGHNVTLCLWQQTRTWQLHMIMLTTQTHDCWTLGCFLHLLGSKQR